MDIIWPSCSNFSFINFFFLSYLLISVINRILFCFLQLNLLCKWMGNPAVVSSSSVQNWCLPKSWKPSCGFICGHYSKLPRFTCRSFALNLSLSKEADTSGFGHSRSSSILKLVIGRALISNMCCRTGSSSHIQTGALI